MKEKEFEALVNELIVDTTIRMKQLTTKAIKSGALDYGNCDNYILPKILTIAICKECAEGWMPPNQNLKVKAKKMVRNLALLL